MSAQSASRPAVNACDVRLAVHSAVAMSTWRCRMAASAAADVFLPLGGRDQVEQRVGDAAAGRQHDGQAGPPARPRGSSATRRMQAASATLDPPNLNTRNDFAMTPRYASAASALNSGTAGSP